MESLEDKSNNEILLMIKQYQLDHESLKISMVKDYDTIKILQQKIKDKWVKLEEVEKSFNEANAIIVRRLKGE